VYHPALETVTSENQESNAVERFKWQDMAIELEAQYINGVVHSIEADLILIEGEFRLNQFADALYKFRASINKSAERTYFYLHRYPIDFSDDVQDPCSVLERCKDLITSIEGDEWTDSKAPVMRLRFWAHYYLAALHDLNQAIHYYYEKQLNLQDRHEELREYTRSKVIPGL
jgi:hypothetical protein